MPSPSPSPSPVNHLKRKEPDSDSDTNPPSPKREPQPVVETISSGTSSSGTATGPARPDEYEAGRVICEACSTGVSFRDDDSGGFTLKHWEAHRITCPAASQRPPAPPIAYAPSTEPLSTHLSSSLHASASIPSASAGPHQPKRRRAKRTEEERIEYLRADPYVGQFEAYRVLCASCDKWIRLRPNSTYCSIPWDAHRKSCLAKKITTKNPYALSERNTLFAKDPDVRKFDPERLLCNMCDRWLSLPPDDHLGAVQRWLSHRASCGRAPGQLPDPSVTANGSSSGSPGTAVNSAPPGEGPEHNHPPSASSLSPRSPSVAHPPGTRYVPGAIAAQGTATSTASPPSALEPLAVATTITSSALQPHLGSPPSPYLLTPLTYAPAHESRRRNAEQRAATLRADRLIGRVEPNRVFCSLCEKWVQLRQDSSYCAYPWVQHRGKCLRRSERRNAKAAELAHAHMKGASSTSTHATHHSVGRRAAHAPHHSSHHSTHPSQSSSSHSGLGYPSAHQHHQQRYHAVNGSRMAHGHGHKAGDEDEDQLMSDGERDERRGSGAPQGLSVSPSVSISGSDDEDERENKYRARNRTHGAARGDDSDDELNEDGEDAADLESEDAQNGSGAEVKPHARKAQTTIKSREDMTNNERRRAHGHARMDDPTRRPRHGPSTSISNGHTQRPRVSHPNGHNGYSANNHGRMSHAIAAGPALYRPPSSSRGASALGPSNGGGGGAQRAAWDGAGDDADAEGEPDAEAEWMEEIEGAGAGGGITNGAHKAIMNRGIPRRPGPVGLADLDSPAGRKNFIQTSLTHLFSTTYEAADELSVSALLAYLNAAMPPDKHEDFDTAEVARAVAELAKRNKVVFEGDIVRVVE